MTERPLPELEGVTHRWVDVPGVRLHVAEAGNGPPLLLLHGWPQHWWLWHAVIGGLAERFRVICPDNRGFGWSEVPPHGYDKRQIALDAVGVLDALGIDEPVGLMGHDWGGYAGFLLCLEHPERVSRYLALNIGHPFGGREPRKLTQIPRFAYQAVLASPVGPAVARALGRAAGHPASEPFTRVRAAEFEPFLAQFRDPARAWATNQLYRTFLTRELGSVLGGRMENVWLKTPTLLLHGDADPVVRPLLLRGYEDQTADMTLEFVPGVGHFIVDERPELVLERALDFFG